MSNKKKFVIVISIISIMILCFSISSLAVLYPDGMELHDGDVIVFKNVLELNDTFSYSLNYNQNLSSYDYTHIDCIESQNYGFLLIYEPGQTYAYAKTTGWNGNHHKTIIIRGDQIITDVDFINWLYENTVSGIPAPYLSNSFWETVSGFFSEALTSGTAIVNWITDTPIALIPLALYCLIVIIAITKHMIKG